MGGRFSTRGLQLESSRWSHFHILLSSATNLRSSTAVGNMHLIGSVPDFLKSRNSCFIFLASGKSIIAENF